MGERAEPVGSGPGPLFGRGGVRNAGRQAMNQDCGSIRSWGENWQAHRCAGPRSPGAPYPVGAALRALVALLRDRKTNGMRVSVQIVGRARAMSLSRKTAEKDKTVSINQNSQRKGLESAKGNSISSQRNLFASIQSEMLLMQHVMQQQHNADDGFLVTGSDLRTAHKAS